MLIVISEEEKRINLCELETSPKLKKGSFTNSSSNVPYRKAPVVKTSLAAEDNGMTALPFR